VLCGHQTIEFVREESLLGEVHLMNIKGCGTTAKAIPPQLGCCRRRIQYVSGKAGIPVAQKSPEAHRSVVLIPLSLPQGPAGFCSTENPLFCTGAQAVQTPDAVF